MPATHHTSPPTTTTPETPRTRKAEAGPRTPEKPSAAPGGGTPAATGAATTTPGTGTSVPATSDLGTSVPATSDLGTSVPATSDPGTSDPGTSAPRTAAPKPKAGGSIPKTGRSAPKKGRSAVPATRTADDPAAPAVTAATAVGRIPVLDVRPVVQHGRRPAKAVVDEKFEVSATVFREGHDAVAANVVLRDPDGRPGPWAPMRELAPGTDRWGAAVSAGKEGRWTYTVEAWGDPVTTWRHHAGIKIPAGMDTELVLEEGALLYERAVAAMPKGPKSKRLRDTVLGAVGALRDTGRPVASRLAAALTPEVDEVLARHPLRDLVTSSEPLPLLVERERALYGAWYEFFPRSESGQLDPPVHGTFRTAAERLPAIAEMGFDVVYLPPVHPIGTTYRKGPDNTLSATPEDVGVPWAIGSPEGGHDAIHPDLGTLEDFDAFVRRAASLKLEIALDFALQCSPDHPWVEKHPEWFHHRPDGTIAHA
ncbi:maltotransferase domain-containing protein, partial [Streptomyces sp. NPDC005141]